MEQKFYEAAETGKVEEVKEILKNDPTLNVNWKNEYGTTVLNRACAYGHDSIVSLLLAHPDIDVNKKDNDGNTPFMWACVFGRTSCVRLLLRDSRVAVNEPQKKGRSPLQGAVSKRHLSVIECMIASGRDMDLGDGIWSTISGTSVLFTAWLQHPEAKDILQMYKHDRSEAVAEAKRRLEITGEWKGGMENSD